MDGNRLADQRRHAIASRELGGRQLPAKTWHCGRRTGDQRGLRGGPAPRTTSQFADRQQDVLALDVLHSFSRKVRPSSVLPSCSGPRCALAAGLLAASDEFFASGAPVLGLSARVYVGYVTQDIIFFHGSGHVRFPLAIRGIAAGTTEPVLVPRSALEGFENPSNFPGG